MIEAVTSVSALKEDVEVKESLRGRNYHGIDYYGAVGITLFMIQNSVVTHNLIHNTAYSGIAWAGYCPGQYENNIVYKNAGSPLFILKTHQNRNTWKDNILVNTHY